MSRRNLQLVLFFFLSAVAHAEFSGRLRAEGQGFFSRQPASVYQHEEALVAEFEERLQFSPHWRARLEPHGRFPSVPHMVDRDVDADLRESYAEVSSGGLRLQAGSLIKAWEGTDGLNPMDIATVKNLRDPLNVENVGSFGLAGGWAGEKLSFDFLYVPWQSPARLPGNSSPWWPRQTSLPLELNNTALLLNDAPEFDVQHHQNLDRALSDNFGGRVQLHFGSTDVAAAFYEGAAQVPLFEPVIYGDLVQSSPKFIVRMQNPIVIRPIEYRRRTESFLFSHTLEGWIFRFAGRYDQPLGDDRRLPSWSDQFVGGVERSITVRNQILILSAQYTYEDRADVTTTILASPDPFQRAVLLGMRAPLSDDWLLAMSGLIDTYRDSSLMRTSLQHRFGAHWSGDVTAEWIRGSDETLLGQWKDKSRGLVSAAYQW